MIFAASAAFLAALLLILDRAKILERTAKAPALLLVCGAAASLCYRMVGGPAAPSEWVAAGADVLLAALGFAAAAQFRISRLATICPASFRLTIGGAPLFLVLCGLAAYVLAPNLTLGAAFLLAGALTLNGAAFDRRAVADAPAPAVIKAAVRLESAAILALGLPVAVMLEAAATVAPEGMPAATPLFETSFSALSAFAVGGLSGLAAGMAGNQLRNKNLRAPLAVAAAAIAALSAGPLGGHPVIAAVAAGLIWGEESHAVSTTRVRLRRVVDHYVLPIAYLACGALLVPQLLQADMLSVVFALAAVTILRAGPRLTSLSSTSLARESQMFLAWFGGAPGVASGLFLISLFDAPSIMAQDAVLTVGALSVILGIAAARATSRPLIRVLLKETALARKRAMFAS